MEKVTINGQEYDVTPIDDSFGQEEIFTKNNFNNSMDSKTCTDRIKEKLQEIFQECDNECEGGNYHHLIGLCESIFESVSSYIPLECRIQAAQEIWRKISKTF